MNSLKNRAALVAVVLAMTAALSACGGNPIKNAVDKAVDKGMEKGVEKVIENAAGDDVDLDVSVDGSAVDLPSDFPSGIHLPEGAILTSTYSAPESGWNLAYSMTSSGPAEGLAAAYKADSSWTNTYESVSAQMSSWVYENGTYQVAILSVGESEEYLLSLTASPLAQ